MRINLMITAIGLSILASTHITIAEDITLSGQVWLDTDADGLYDANEMPLADCTLMANRAYSVQTAEDGTYQLTVPAGIDYRITALCDSNWLQTTPLAPAEYQYGGTQVLIPQDNGKAEVVTVKGDDQGNLYLAGYFSGTVDFDPSLLGEDLVSSQGGRVFVTKLNADQSYGWTAVIPSTSQAPEDLAVSNTDVFVVGSRYSTSYGYIAKLDSEGNLNWMHSFQYAFVHGICVDPNAGLYITGNFSGSVDFDPNENLTETRKPQGQSDLFLMNMSQTGDLLWVQTTGYMIARAQGQRVCLDSEGNIFVGGFFRYKMDFAPGSTKDLIGSSGDEDSFVCRYDRDGTYAWTFHIKGSYRNKLLDMKIDPLDRLVLVGNYNHNTTFGQTGPYVISSDKAAQAFVLQLDHNGDFLWMESLNLDSVGTDMSNYYASATGVSIDRLCNIYIVGERVTDSSGLGYEDFRGGTSDLFLWQLDSDGVSLDFDLLNHLSQTAGTSYYFEPTVWDIAIDALGDSQVAGRFSNTSDLAPGGITDSFTPQGQNDGFVITQERLHGVYEIAAASGSQEGLDFGLWNLAAIEETLNKTTVELSLVDSNEVDSNSVSAD